MLKQLDIGIEKIVQNDRQKEVTKRKQNLTTNRKSQNVVSHLRVDQIAEAYMSGKSKTTKKPKESIITANDLQTVKPAKKQRYRRKSRNNVMQLRYDEAYNEVEFLLLDETQKSQSQLLHKKTIFRRQNQDNVQPINFQVVTKDTKLDKLRFEESQKEEVFQQDVQQRLKRIKNLLQGTIATIWIFIMPKKQNKYKHTVMEMYKGLITDDYVVPWCTDTQQAQQFLSITGSCFKIVVSLQQMAQISTFKNNPNIIQLYIYNDQGQSGLVQALEYKRKNPKIKSVLVGLEKIVAIAQDQVEDQVQIFMCNKGFQKMGKRFKFPSFLKLTGKDKTEATQYRINLYGAIKLKESEKYQSFQSFMRLVYLKYDIDGGQADNIKDYLKIDHSKSMKSLQQAKNIIQFYVRQSFYYQIVNSMLRTIKSVNQFKHCALPFSQTYHAIKMYYQYEVGKTKMIPAMTLYRGSRLRKRDFKSLKKGSFIQMFGFMSTSKSLQLAESFTDKDGYLFVIHVNASTITGKMSQYDHGFVDINKYQLANSSFASEEEVLFNALNIYRVGDIEELNNYTLIHLHYGVIFQLIKKKYNQLTVDQKDVLINYQYCTELQHKIEDQGDLYMLSNELDEAEKYYKQILQTNDDAEAHLKLANICQEKGNTKAAEQHGNKSRSIISKMQNINDRETCMKVFSIHSKNAQLSVENEDYLNADEDLTNAIQMLGDQDLFERGKKIRQRGEIKFKKGEIIQAEKDFAQSERTLESLNEQYNKKLQTIQIDYYLKLITICCSGLSLNEIRTNRYDRIQQVKQSQKEIDNIHNDISDELNKVNKSLKEVAEYANNKQKYEKCVRNARAYLAKLKERETNDPILKAKYKVIQATVQTYLQLAQTQKLLNDAIKLVQSGNPYDINVAEYSTILAKLQKQELSKLQGIQKVTDKPVQAICYNQTQCKEIHDKSINNYKKALNVLLYNNKQPENPQVLNLKNQMGQLEYCFNNFSSCEQIVKEMKQSCPEVYNTELAKSSLILSKIALARGEIRYAFEVSQEADTILQKAIIKDKNDVRYMKVYKNSDVYLEISFTRSKIYHKQMKHDLALNQLKQLQSNLLHKMDGYESHILLSKIYEEYAQVQFTRGNKGKFDQYFKKAIIVRERQMGQYNLLNITSFCNYAKFLIVQGDLQTAEQYINKAAQILTCYTGEHPITWIIYFIQALYKQKVKKPQESEAQLRRSIGISKRNFDPSQIFVKKLRLMLAKKLLKKEQGGHIQQSIQMLQELDTQLDEGLRVSQSLASVAAEVDDEKITIKKMMYSQLQQTYKNYPQAFSINHTSQNIYETKFNQLRSSYQILVPKNTTKL